MAKQNASGVLRMPYSRQSAKQDLNKKSVALVEKYARIVFVIDENGTPVCSWTNGNYNLDAIVVLGDVSGFGLTILLEIGISRARPYTQAYGRKKKSMHRRHKFFSLNETQIHNLLPFLEEKILVLTRNRVETWKFDTYIMKKPRYHVVNSYGLKERSGDKEKMYIKGARFSVSHEDKLLVGVVIRSELNKRQVCIKSDVAGAGKLAASLLRGYHPDTLRSKKKLAQYSTQKSSIVAAVDFLRKRNFLPHQLFLLLESLSGYSRECVEYILEYMDVDMGEVEKWGMLLDKDLPTFSGAFTYCIQRRRNGENRRDVYDSKRKKWKKMGSKKQDFLVFETALNKTND